MPRRAFTHHGGTVTESENGIDPIQDTLSQILVCRRARYGCTGAWSFELGQEETAQRIREDHEKNRCLYRHFPI